MTTLRVARAGTPTGPRKPNIFFFSLHLGTYLPASKGLTRFFGNGFQPRGPMEFYDGTSDFRDIHKKPKP